MKYLKVYESFFEAPESDLYYLVWDCIDNTYPNKKDLKNELFSDPEEEITQDTWISLVLGCFYKDDIKELGTYFIKQFVKGEKNKDLFFFLQKKFRDIDEEISESILKTWNF